jgi:hypothetical protein
MVCRRNRCRPCCVSRIGPRGRRSSLGQELIRNALWHFYQTSAAHQLIKNLIYFVFIFSFALLRLWVTLLVLTWGLKQSCVLAG